MQSMKMLIQDVGFAAAEQKSYCITPILVQVQFSEQETQPFLRTALPIERFREAGSK